MDKLIQDCINGDKRAQNKFYSHYKGVLLSICKRYTKDDDTANEMLQLGLIKIFANLNKYDQNTPFVAWFKRIMINSCLDCYRSLNRRGKKLGYSTGIIDNEDPLSASVLAVNDVEENDLEEIVELIKDELSLLPKASQTAFRLFFLENKTHKEIANLLDISESTSKTNTFKAKNKLKLIISNKVKEKDLFY